MNITKLDYNLMIKLSIGDEMLGPGLMKFLELTEECGSMQLACEKMGMAYSKGWKVLRNAEKVLGEPLLVRVTGGTGGGGSSLTESGHMLVTKYKEFSEAMDRAAEENFRRIFGD